MPSIQTLTSYAGAGLVRPYLVVFAAPKISEHVWGQRSELPKTCFTGPCHDFKPWTTNNRVLLCQATLSIGLYLLLEGAFRQHHSTSPLPIVNIKFGQRRAEICAAF